MAKTVLYGIETNLIDDPAVGAVVGNYRDVTAQKGRSRSKYSARPAVGSDCAPGPAASLHRLQQSLVRHHGRCFVRREVGRAGQPGIGRARGHQPASQCKSRRGSYAQAPLPLGRTQPLTMEYLDAGDIVSDFPASLMRDALSERTS